MITVIALHDCRRRCRRPAIDNRQRRQMPMYRLTVVYDEPADKGAFDHHYTDENDP